MNIVKLKWTSIAALMLFVCNTGDLKASVYGEDSISAVRIGEKVPDLLLTRLAGFPAGSARLSELYRDRLLVLDFWTTTCAVCVAQFPKLKQLQDQFGESITILPVGLEDPNYIPVVSFLETRKGTNFELKLPYAVEDGKDSRIRKAFPSAGVPHLVWIDRNGYLIAITGHNQLTDKKLTEVLAGNIGQLVNKEERRYTKIKPQTKTVLFDYDAGGDRLRYGAVLTGYNDTLVPSVPIGHQPDPRVTKLWAINAALPDLYRLAYEGAIPGLMETGGLHRIVYETDPGLTKRLLHFSFASPRDDAAFRQFQKDSVFCYESVHPARVSLSKAREFMIADLDRFFGLRSRVEKRPVRCLILVRTGTKPSYEPKSVKLSAAEAALVNGKLAISYTSLDMDRLLAILRDDLYAYTVLNETGYQGLIDFVHVRDSRNNVVEIRRRLQKTGFDLVEADRELDLLVLE